MHVDAYNCYDVGSLTLDGLPLLVMDFGLTDEIHRSAQQMQENNKRNYRYSCKLVCYREIESVSASVVPIVIFRPPDLVKSGRETERSRC